MDEPQRIMSKSMNISQAQAHYFILAFISFQGSIVLQLTKVSVLA